MARISKVKVRHLIMPLIRPYHLSYRTFYDFEPFLVEIQDSDEKSGFADVHISPGSSSETREHGWQFIIEKAESIIGLETVEAKDRVLAGFDSSRGAATALVSAIEVLERNPKLDLEKAVHLPLLVPINSTEVPAIRQEVEDLLGKGFRTLKVKVGKDVEADLQRVAAIQEACSGRADLRLDANRAFSKEQGMTFAQALEPEGIELFEQPCNADDWAANAAVAKVSRVPLMLDEPICTIEDIERAGRIDNVRYCKLKLKRFGGLDRLQEGLEAVFANGMRAVLGDGLGSEIQGWLEACIASRTIDNAGEFNGFLKPYARLLENPLSFEDGAIDLPKGYWPILDERMVAQVTVNVREF